MRKGQKVGSRKFSTSVKSISLDNVLDEYCNLCKRRGLSDVTIQGYQYGWKYFLEFLENDNIYENVIIDYISYLQDKNYKATTINSYIRNISPILNYGYDMGYWHKPKYIEVKKQDTIKEIYTDNELKLLLAPPKSKDFVNLRNWAIVWTLASTGIRRNELINLRIANYDPINRTLLLNATKNKKPRYVPVSNSLYEVLTEYLKVRGGNPSDYLFPTVYNNKMSSSTVNKEIALYNNSRNVTKTSIHLFRHTFITNSVNKNVNPLVLKKITGHSNFQILNNYYNAKTKDIVDVIDSITPSINRKQFK